METVLNLLLIRFAIIAAIIAVVAVIAFAIAVRLKRRGRWEATRDRVLPMITRAADAYAKRSDKSWHAAAVRKAADRMNRRE